MDIYGKSLINFYLKMLKQMIIEYIDVDQYYN